MSKFAKLFYLVVITALLIKPFFIVGSVSFISEPVVRMLTTSILLGVAALFYYFHQDDIKKREKEKNFIEKKLDISEKQYNEAIKYIGLVNRRLPLLQEITTELISGAENTKQAKKQIFITLLNTATMSIADAEWGMFRFIDTSTQKTAKEFITTSRNYVLLKTEVSNKLLLNTAGKKSRILMMNDLNYVVTSDKRSNIRCYFIFLNKKQKKFDTEIPLLQSITDQAQLFFKYLY